MERRVGRGETDRGSRWGKLKKGKKESERRRKIRKERGSRDEEMR